MLVFKVSARRVLSTELIALLTCPTLQTEDVTVQWAVRTTNMTTWGLFQKQGNIVSLISGVFCKSCNAFQHLDERERAKSVRFRRKTFVKPCRKQTSKSAHGLNQLVPFCASNWHSCHVTMELLTLRLLLPLNATGQPRPQLPLVVWLYWIISAVVAVCSVLRCCSAPCFSLSSLAHGRAASSRTVMLPNAA